MRNFLVVAPFNLIRRMRSDCSWPKKNHAPTSGACLKPVGDVSPRHYARGETRLIVPGGLSGSDLLRRDDRSCGIDESIAIRFGIARTESVSDYAGERSTISGRTTECHAVV